jgi:hypothetical protein
MSIYRTRPLDLGRVHTYPLRSRPSKVSISNFAKAPTPGASIRNWVKSLPRILAGETFRAVVAALERARQKRKPIIWGLGGHVIKVGLSPVLIDLLRRGYITAVAMNTTSDPAARNNRHQADLANEYRNRMSINQYLSSMFGQEFADNRRPEFNGISRVYQKMAVLSKIG